MNLDGRIQELKTARFRGRVTVIFDGLGGASIEEKEEPPISDRRLFFTADKSRLVEEGDPAAAVLACAAGKPLPAGMVAPEPRRR